MTRSTPRRHEWTSSSLASVALVFVLTTWPHVVRAQAPEPAGYRGAVDEAVREFELAHFQESLALFERAHTLYPNARTWRGIGMTEFELRHYARCIEALSTALASTERPLDGALRTDTEQLLARARSFAGEVQLELSPSTATLRIDGLSVTPGAANVLVLAAGDHVFEADAAGYLSERRAVNVAGGSAQAVKIALAAPVAEAPKPSVPAPAEPEKRPLRKNPWLWTAVGVVAAGAVVGIAVASSGGGGTAKPYTGTGNALVPGP